MSAVFKTMRSRRVVATVWATAILSIQSTAPLSAAVVHASHFPGEQLLPRETSGPDELVRILYGNRTTINDPNHCGPDPCLVRLVANQIFGAPDGHQHAIVVTAAEPQPAHASHASRAVIGMAWLTHTNKGWVLDLGSPNVVAAGASGKGPDAHIIQGGIWGKAIVLQHDDVHQGEAERHWQLFVPDHARGNFSRGLELVTMHDSTGSCPGTYATADCLKGDHQTKLVLATEEDGISVIATTTFPLILNRQSETIDLPRYQGGRSEIGGRIDTGPMRPREQSPPTSEATGRPGIFVPGGQSTHWYPRPAVTSPSP